MIDKKEDKPGTPDAESLAQTCQHLEEMMLQAQSEVRSAFARITEALNSREKQLLRQIDVAHTQQLAVVQSRSDNVPHVTVQLDQEIAVTEAISSLGTVGLTGGSLVDLNADGSFLQRMEDYQDANQDHMSMFKPVPLDSSSSSPVQEAVICFSHITLPQSTPKPAADLNENEKSHAHSESPHHINNSSPNHDSKEANNTQKKQHPTQVQQWLKQLSAETETEPSIGEPKNFEPLQNING